ncbi:MAG: hypothetical protein H7Z37_12510, partial [Pyrinomonadaceae bacterium]|nr:hypothetical protein [Pyrinomonadaceae bacterium]
MSPQNTKLSLNYVFRESLKQAENGKSPLLLLLHGIGSNEHDLFGLTPYLDERFFIASAQAPIALDSQAFAWFELSFSLQGMTANLEQAETSRQLLINFIAELIEKHDLNAEKVFLCGFSQGAIMSHAVMLSATEKLAGIVAMSGRMISKELLQNADSSKLKDFPVLIVHGKHDTVLTIDNA